MNKNNGHAVTAVSAKVSLDCCVLLIRLLGTVHLSSHLMRDSNSLPGYITTDYNCTANFNLSITKACLASFSILPAPVHFVLCIK